MAIAKGLLAFLSIAAAVTVAVVLLAGGTASGSPAHRAALSTPSAAEFASDLVGVTNKAAPGNGGAHLSNVNCVQAAPGRYMCSYSVEKHGASTCHLMQGRWTPDLPSAITITLAGRTGRCGTLKEAIRTLQ
jgi:hypothetical protein